MPSLFIGLGLVIVVIVTVIVLDGVLLLVPCVLIRRLGLV